MVQNNIQTNKNKKAHRFWMGDGPFYLSAHYNKRSSLLADNKFLLLDGAISNLQRDGIHAALHVGEI